MSHIIIALKFTLKTQDDKIHYTIHQVRIARNTPSHLMNKNRKASIDNPFKYLQDTLLAHHVAHRHRTQIHTQNTRQQNPLHYTPSLHSTKHTFPLDEQKSQNINR